MLKLRGVQHVHVESAIWTVWETGWQGLYSIKKGPNLVEMLIIIFFIQC